MSDLFEEGNDVLRIARKGKTPAGLLRQQFHPGADLLKVVNVGGIETPRKTADIRIEVRTHRHEIQDYAASFQSPESPLKITVVLRIDVSAGARVVRRQAPVRYAAMAPVRQDNDAFAAR